MQNRIKKHRNRIVTILALAVLTLFVISSSASPQDDARSVREVLIQSATGFEKGDMAALEKLWANDESVTVFESGHANYGWADYRDQSSWPRDERDEEHQVHAVGYQGQGLGKHRVGYFQIRDFSRYWNATCRGLYSPLRTTFRIRWCSANESHHSLLFSANKPDSGRTAASKCAG